MKKFIALIVLVVVGVFSYRIAGSLSGDAVSMAIGIFFGILAGIPTALLVLASNRRRQEDMSQEFNRSRQNNQAYQQLQQQPPVIILTVGQPQQFGQQNQNMLQGPPPVNPTQQGRFVNLEEGDGW